MIKFGPAGNSQSFYDAGYKSSLDVPEFLAAQGLNAYEYQCGRGVRVKEDFCRQLAAKASENQVALSLHAPYFINLATKEAKVMESSLNHIRKSLVAAAAMEASRIVVHPGSVAKDSTRKEALHRAEKLLGRVVEELLPDYPGIYLCLETMGKLNQLGDLEEVLYLCTLDNQFIPTIDFGHLHTRGLGKVNSGEEFEAVLDQIDSALGAEVVQNLHVHFSPIEYGAKGEIRHRTMAETEYGPHFEPLAEIIVRDKLTPVIISESAGTQTEDALTMKALYTKAQEAKA
ncbi:MAG: TIM barrel protein [Firmicutes bacterium]|nr:TIM barrel protein [Bacillota bacterium]